MKPRNKLWENLAGQSDLPDEVFPGQSLIEIIEDRRVLIENHCGVKEYGSETICVQVKFGILRICGNNLHLRCMTRTKLVIAGCIQSISISRRTKP